MNTRCVHQEYALNIFCLYSKKSEKCHQFLYGISQLVPFGISNNNHIVPVDFFPLFTKKKQTNDAQLTTLNVNDGIVPVVLSQTHNGQQSSDPGAESQGNTETYLDKLS